MICRVLEQPITNAKKTQPISINAYSQQPLQQQMSRTERTEVRYQYDLKPDIFDPFSSSPTETFMSKLKERIHSYSNQCGFPLHTKDLIRNSE